MKMLITLFNWTFTSPGNVLISYALGFLAYAFGAILIWGYVYRPNMRDHGDTPWDTDEIVEFAFAQAIIWPAFLALYVILAVVILIYNTIAKGGVLLTNGFNNILPRERPAGFQLPERLKEHARRGDSRW
jgi:hypothetical protein